MLTWLMRKYQYDIRFLEVVLLLSIPARVCLKFQIMTLSMHERGLSGQQVQAEVLTKNLKTRLTVFSQGDNVINHIPSIAIGPVDEKKT